MKAPVVALFLVLDVTQALWLNAEEDAMPNELQAPPQDRDGFKQPVELPEKDATDGEPKEKPVAFPGFPGGFGGPEPWEAAAKPPPIRAGTGEALLSGDLFALESEVEPGKFVSMREEKPDEMGDPMKWLEMKHITNGQMGLMHGITPNSTFSMRNDDSSVIKSSDFVKWYHGDGQMDLLMTHPLDNDPGEKLWMWPHPIVKKKPNKFQQEDFKIEHAREIDQAELTSKPNFLGAWGWSPKLLSDPRKGELIKDGDSVWLSHKASTGSTSGAYLFMSGDVGEGDHVSFPHHYPGFDGRVKHYAVEKWMKGGNDNHATSSRFTIRKINPDQLISQTDQQGYDWKKNHPDAWNDHQNTLQNRDPQKTQPGSKETSLSRSSRKKGMPSGSRVIDPSEAVGGLKPFRHMHKD